MMIVIKNEEIRRWYVEEKSTLKDDYMNNENLRARLDEIIDLTGLSFYEIEEELHYYALYNSVDFVVKTFNSDYENIFWFGNQLVLRKH